MDSFGDFFKVSRTHVTALITATATTATATEAAAEYARQKQMNEAIGEQAST